MASGDQQPVVPARERVHEEAVRRRYREDPSRYCLQTGNSGTGSRQF